MFKTFEVVGDPVRVKPGAVLKLSAEQFKRRRNLVTEKSRGTYVVKSAFDFKVGEKITVDLSTCDTINPKQLQQDAEIAAAEKAAADKAAAEAEAKRVADEEAAKAAAAEAEAKRLAEEAAKKNT